MLEGQIGWTDFFHIVHCLHAIKLCCICLNSCASNSSHNQLCNIKWRQSFTFFSELPHRHNIIYNHTSHPLFLCGVCWWHIACCFLCHTSLQEFSMCPFLAGKVFITPYKWWVLRPYITFGHVILRVTNRSRDSIESQEISASNIQTCI